MAGRRSGRDALAQAQGLSHKALIPVAGEPMIARVLRSVEHSGLAASLQISIDAPDALRGVAEVERLERLGRLRIRASRESPSASVLAALEEAGPEPLLVTTADHPLLSSAALRAFWTTATATPGADVAVAVVGEQRVRERFPASRRTFIPLRGEGVTGANLFGFLGPGATGAVRFWRGAEVDRKRPWRLVAHFGPASLLQFLLRRLDLEEAFARASGVVGARLVPVPMDDPECAFDVDRPEHLAFVAEVLKARETKADRGIDAPYTPRG